MSGVKSRIGPLSVFALGVLLGLPAVAEIADVGESEIDYWVPSDFLILRSTTDYAEAHRFAESASKRLEIPLDLRGLIFDPRHGLTAPKEICDEDELYPYPCYLARGRVDQGVYVSIERSDAYESFRPGYFIVIAASDSAGSAAVASTLTKARAVYSDAYVKRAEIYHGCMH